MLHQLFCDSDEMETTESTEEWLESHKDAIIQDIIDPLASRAAQIVQRVKNQDGCTVLTGSTGPQLLKQLRPYATARSSDDTVRRRAIWPLIAVIRVAVKDARVVRNLILVDMPGKYTS